MNKGASTVFSALMILLFVSCINGNDKTTTTDYSVEEQSYDEVAANDNQIKDEMASEITQKMCSNFPEDLVMQYNTDAKKLEIESVELIPGQQSPCKVKLYYGDKDYEFWEGQVGAWDPKSDDPLWQYNTKRNPNNYYEVTEFGEQAVFIASTNQLLVKKDGLLYSIAAPCRRGKTTNTGKDIKALVFEIARHYKL